MSYLFKVRIPLYEREKNSCQMWIVSLQTVKSRIHTVIVKKGITCHHLLALYVQSCELNTIFCLDQAFIRFRDRKHPKDLPNAEIEQLLNHLDIAQLVSAHFMYKQVIKREIVGLNYSLTKKPRWVPTKTKRDTQIQSNPFSKN